MDLKTCNRFDTMMKSSIAKNSSLRKVDEPSYSALFKAADLSERLSQVIVSIFIFLNQQLMIFL